MVTFKKQGILIWLLVTSCAYAGRWSACQQAVGEHVVTVVPVSNTLCNEVHERYYYRKARVEHAKNPTFGPILGNFFTDIVQDAFWLNIGLISWDSFKIIGSVFPFYIGARMVDNKVHRCFYRGCHHRNVTQLPSWCQDIAEWSIALPIIVLGIQGFLDRNDAIRETGRMLLIGLPFVIWGKDIIKKFDADFCLRPWNERFSCRQRSLGGFPSGHLAEITYMAVLYGMRFGPICAVPFGILAGAVAITFLNCNRHYLSQLIAGAGLGAMYAVSANKIIDGKLENITVGLSAGQQGPLFSLSYAF